MRVIPNTLSTSRFALTPLLWTTLNIGSPYSIPTYIVVCLTDILDGKIARKTNSTSTLGSLLDASADFSIILIGMTHFTLQGLVPAWLLAVIVASFNLYILTFKAQIKDQLGKHIGTILFVMLGLVIAYPSIEMGTFASTVAGAYILAALITRAVKVMSQLEAQR